MNDATNQTENEGPADAQSTEVLPASETLTVLGNLAPPVGAAPATGLGVPPAPPEDVLTVVQMDSQPDPVDAVRVAFDAYLQTLDQRRATLFARALGMYVSGDLFPLKKDADLSESEKAELAPKREAGMARARGVVPGLDRLTPAQTKPFWEAANRRRNQLKADARKEVAAKLNVTDADRLAMIAASRDQHIADAEKKAAAAKKKAEDDRLMADFRRVAGKIGTLAHIELAQNLRAAAAALPERAEEVFLAWEFAAKTADEQAATPEAQRDLMPDLPAAEINTCELFGHVWNEVPGYIVEDGLLWELRTRDNFADLLDRALIERARELEPIEIDAWVATFNNPVAAFRTHKHLLGDKSVEAPPRPIPAELTVNGKRRKRLSRACFDRFVELSNAEKASKQ